MITEQQLKQCIAEIGLLALSTSSCVMRQMTVHEGVGSEELGFQWFPNASLLATANALLELAKVVKDNWDAIEKRPLRTFVTEVAPVDIKQMFSSPQSLIKAKLNPSNRQTIGFNRVESNQCRENEFLCYILDVYLKDLVNGIANALDSLTIEEIVIPYISPKFADLRPDFMAAVRVRIQRRNGSIIDERRHLAETVSQLRACTEWATQARSAAFLKSVITPDEPPFPSLRLTGSPTYGSIFEQYSNCCAGSLAAIQRVLYLFRCTYQGQVRPTWEIYKIWCVARLYSAFIMDVNMRPPNGEPTMFECIQIKRGMLELPKNRAFKLQGCLDNGKQFSITFWYQPELQNSIGELVIPDIKVEISIEEDNLFQYNQRENNRLYCFNVEARNYQKQGEHQFIEDVIVVAKNKYLEPLQMNASFILHTDIQVDYWGEVPVSRILEDKFSLTIKDSGYVGHKYGAISLIPGLNTDRQIKKILQLLLKYHNKSLFTACLSCGHQLEKEKEEIQASWIPTYISESELIDRALKGGSNAGSATGIYCSCSLCGDFWVVQICWGKHHPLLKLIDCFHRNSDHPEFRGRWMYICPECGSDPTLAQILAARGSGF